MRAPSLTAPLNLAMLLLGLAWLASPAQAAGDKVTICHIPPGNPENVQIIDVSASAAQKHIDRHGDSIFGGEEVCDGVDNDCNGFVDEGFPLGQFCEDGISDCRQTGVLICDPDDAAQTTCSAVALDPTEPDGEVTCAGGADEDCDGQIGCADSDCAWDGSPSDLTCKNPVCPDGIVDAGEECDGGACCTASCTFASAGTVCGIDEVCRQELCDAAHECVLENLDTTCDTDPNGPNNTCDVSNDVCEAGVCVNTDPNPLDEVLCDGLDNDCDASTPDSSAEICDDGIDNNCDGEVDEGCSGPSCDVCANECEEQVALGCFLNPAACPTPEDAAELLDTCLQGACPDCVPPPPTACETCAADCEAYALAVCAGAGVCTVEQFDELVGQCIGSSCEVCSPCDACTQQCIAAGVWACVPAGCTDEEAAQFFEICLADGCGGVCS